MLNYAGINPQWRRAGSLWISPIGSSYYGKNAELTQHIPSKGVRLIRRSGLTHQETKAVGRHWLHISQEKSNPLRCPPNHSGFSDHFLPSPAMKFSPAKDGSKLTLTYFPVQPTNHCSSVFRIAGTIILSINRRRLVFKRGYKRLGSFFHLRLESVHEKCRVFIICKPVSGYRGNPSLIHDRFCIVYYDGYDE